MTPLATALAAFLVGNALVQACFTSALVRLFYRGAKPEVPDSALPKVAVLLPLRGADPQLGEGLRRLLQQRYPSYCVRVVVDRRDDPAWEVVQDAVRQVGASHVRVEPIAEGRLTCSRQCSALIQAVESLEDDIEVVAIVDGDVLTHPDWLRQLVAPLLTDGVGIAHGNRWFMPPRRRWGSLVRYLRNAGAVVPMWLFSIPWGGTFAIRRSVLEQSGLLDKWPRALVHDAPAKSLLKKMGLRIVFVPSLMMVNREECTVAFSLDFMKRQMTWTRVYHPDWVAVAVHAVATTAAIAVATLLVPIAWLAGERSAAAWAGGGLGGYLLLMVLLLAMLEAGVRRAVRAQGEHTDWIAPGGWLKVALAIPVTQCIYLIGVLLASFKRRIAFRGVTYRIDGPWDVSVVADRAPTGPNGGGPNANA